MKKNSKKSTRKLNEPSKPQASTALSAVGGGPSALAVSNSEEWRAQAAAEIMAASKDRALSDEYMRKHPEMAEFLDPLATAIEKWVERCGETHFRRAAIAARVRKLMRDLVGPTPSEIERQLAGRAAICWLQVVYWDTEIIRPGERSFKLGEYQADCHDIANRRYLKALKTLAEVQRLRLPAVQVNIGEKQINVAG